MKKRCWVMKNRCNYHFLLNIYWAQCTLWQAVSGWSQLSSSSQFSEKDYHFFNLKMPLLSTHFISIFTRSCQIHCFLHTLPAIQQSWKFRVSIWHKKDLKFSTLLNSKHSVQKAVDLKFLVKIEIKWVERSGIFRL